MMRQYELVERVAAYNPQVDEDLLNRAYVYAMQKHGAIYLAAFGGAGALLSQSITEVQLVAFEDAGPEAMFRFTIQDFPAVVINDVLGSDFYEQVAAQKTSEK